MRLGAVWRENPGGGQMARLRDAGFGSGGKASGGWHRLALTLLTLLLATGASQAQSPMPAPTFANVNHPLSKADASSNYRFRWRMTSAYIAAGFNVRYRTTTNGDWTTANAGKTSDGSNVFRYDLPGTAAWTYVEAQAQAYPVNTLFYSNSSWTGSRTMGTAQTATPTNTPTITNTPTSTPTPSDTADANPDRGWRRHPIGQQVQLAQRHPLRQRQRVGRRLRGRRRSRHHPADSQLFAHGGTAGYHLGGHGRGQGLHLGGARVFPPLRLERRRSYDTQSDHHRGQCRRRPWRGRSAPRARRSP